MLRPSPPQFCPGQLWPDDHGVHINAHGGGFLVHKDVIYWFGEHKIAGPAGNAAHVGVHCHSSMNLYDWRDEGIVLPVARDRSSEITKGCVLERPKVIYNAGTKKFVMWFHLEPKGKAYHAARSGVAVADAPTGPYRFLGSLRPNAGVWPLNAPEELKKPLASVESTLLAGSRMDGTSIPSGAENLIFRRDFKGGQMARDMTLFVDDTGEAYHIYSSEENSTLHISRLSDDFLRPAGRYARVLVGEFNEAPVAFKHAGKYWLITSGCTGWKPNAARLAVADSIWGPWQTLGNPCIGEPDAVNTTFQSQGTFVLPVPGRTGAFIFMADRWQPRNAVDGRYVWLPIEFDNGLPRLRWRDAWGLEVFDS